MLHLFILGIFLGWGAAIPIGPINLEMIRRNLKYGTRYGIALGSGANCADLTYLLLLSYGALIFLKHPFSLKLIGFLGACLLAWFGLQAIRATSSAQSKALGSMTQTTPLVRHIIEGYLLTLVNPITILFWTSISAQVVALTGKAEASPWIAGLGVLTGTYSWVLTVNTVVHFIRHKLSNKTMHRLNVLGGSILLIFSVIGFYNVFS